MKCVSYTRTLPWKNHQSELTIAEQNQRIAAYLAEYKELDLQKKYSDRKNDVKARTAFDQMTNDGVERKFDCIIVASMDVVVSNLVNTMYCRDAGKKLRTANQVKWRKGITTASAAPFGYQFDPDKKGAFIIDPPAAKIVRRIFDLAILGLGTREIAMMLNDENVPVPSVYNKENKAYGKETTLECGLLAMTVPLF